MPCVNAAYVEHPEFDQSVATLRAGVAVLYGEGGFVPNRPGEGRPEAYPWRLALTAAELAQPMARRIERVCGGRVVDANEALRQYVRAHGPRPWPHEELAVLAGLRRAWLAEHAGLVEAA